MGPMRRRSSRRGSTSRASTSSAAGRRRCAVGLRAGAARARVRRGVRVARDARRAPDAPAAVAAREGRTWGVLWRRPGAARRRHARRCASALAPRKEGRLAVRVLKRRGGELAQPVHRRPRCARVIAARTPSRHTRCPHRRPGPRIVAAHEAVRATSAPHDARSPCPPRCSPTTSTRWPATTRGRTTACSPRAAAVAGRLRRDAHELLPVDQGDAQPQPHRRLVLRRRARTGVRAARAPIAMSSVLRAGRALRRPARSCAAAQRAVDRRLVARATRSTDARSRRRCR